jgi:hypothetical protein
MGVNKNEKFKWLWTLIKKRRCENEWN